MNHPSPSASARRALLLTLALAAGAAGCIDESSQVLPPASNSTWRRSITIDASRCLLKDGTYASCASAEPAQMQRVAHMSGVNGAPLAAVELDPNTKLVQSFPYLVARWARIPVGYGCRATLQGVFPDRSKDEKDWANYDFSRLSEIIGATRGQVPWVVWTAAYGLGKGDGACAYAEHGLRDGGAAVAEQSGADLGTTSDDLQKWARVVRRVVEYYDLELPAQKAEDSACNPPAGTAKPWFCTPSLFNIEYGRDPNGAGGFTEETKARWLEAYKHFAAEIRGKFPLPQNSISLLAPSVVIRGKAAVATTAPGPGRSWIFDFIDYVVKEKLALSFLTVEVEAATPVEADAIVRAVRKYADEKGLLGEEGQPIPIFVTDLRVSETKLPKSLLDDPARRSAYHGAFYAATKALWQGRVFGATVGRAVRTLSRDPATVSAVEVATQALDSDLHWFKPTPPDPGALKPAAWHSFWFNDGYLGGGGGALDTCTPAKAPCPDDVAGAARRKSMLLIGQGPDALGLSGDKKSDIADGLIAIATRERCVSSAPDSLGEPRECLSASDVQSFPALGKDRKNVVRIFVADLNTEVAERETLRHDLTVFIQGLPQDIKTVGVRWAPMDGDEPTWTGHIFPEQALVAVVDGTVTVQRTVAVPSMHYFELLY
jgi:hypothetical protein